MAWLDSLKYGNELSELLIEGHNPYSASLLQAADVAPLQPHLSAGERLQAYVLGRVVLAGRGLWVLTEGHVLMNLEGTAQPVLTVALKDITEAQCQRGKYGYTLRITVAGQCWSLYGTSAALAAAFYASLQRSVHCTPVFKPAQLDADDIAQATHHIQHAAALLQPAAHALAQGTPA